jgi:hypothetical protein
MAEFEEAVSAWRNQPFPPGSSTDAVDELHADLALADTWVAEAVVPFMERGVHRSPQVDVDKRLHELRVRTAELTQNATNETRELMHSYRDYIDRLLRVYTAFTEQGESRTHHPSP